MLNRSGSGVHRRDAASRFYCVTRIFSICYVALFGGAFVFSMLSFGLARASALPEALGIWHAQIANPALSVASPDAAVKLDQSASKIHVPDTEVGDNPRAEEIPAGESEMSKVQIATGMGSAAIVLYGSIALVVALVALTTVALGGGFRMHAVLKSALAEARGAESEWQRRYADVEGREQAARAIAAAQVAIVSAEERDRLHASIHHLVSGPLDALAALLDVLNGEPLSTSQRALAARIHAAARILSRVLEDMLTRPTVDPSLIVLDESPMDPRELVDGVVALFSPAAAQKQTGLSVSIDRSLSACILADSARLGQITFHLLSRAVRSTEGGQITVAVRAEPINSGSQRVYISVRNEGANEGNSSVSSTHVQRPLFYDGDMAVNTSQIDDDASLTLCQQLARHMRGDLKFEIEAGLGRCSTFSAPFAIEHLPTSTMSAHAEVEPSQQAHHAARPTGGLHIPPSESFDQSYLAALSNEGIDLDTFVRAWRQSLNDDLERMRGLRTRHDFDGVRSTLHRLSGAVGLVGACGLMETLRQASVIGPEPEAVVLDALAGRIEALMMQLDEAIHPH